MISPPTSSLHTSLPSGSGVVAVESGKSSTIGEDGRLVSNATGGAGQQDDVTPFMGGAADSRARLGSLACRMAAAVVLLTSLVWY